MAPRTSSLFGGAPLGGGATSTTDKEGGAEADNTPRGNPKQSLGSRRNQGAKEIDLEPSAEAGLKQYTYYSITQKSFDLCVSTVKPGKVMGHNPTNTPCKQVSWEAKILSEQLEVADKGPMGARG